MEGATSRGLGPPNTNAELNSRGGSGRASLGQPHQHPGGAVSLLHVAERAQLALALVRPRPLDRLEGPRAGRLPCRDRANLAGVGEVVEEHPPRHVLAFREPEEVEERRGDVEDMRPLDPGAGPAVATVDP